MNDNKLNNKLEELQLNGFTVLENVISAEDLTIMQNSFDAIAKNFEDSFDSEKINENELGTLRCIISLDKAMHKLFFVQDVASLMEKYVGKYIYYSFNGFYTSDKFVHPTTLFHRDIKTFTNNAVLSVNLLYNLDKTSAENGATWMVPGSHKFTPRPSDDYIDANKVQVFTEPGSVIVFNSLTYHASGINYSGEKRRSIANVLRLPYMKPQFNWSQVFDAETINKMDDKIKSLFSLDSMPANSLDEYYAEGIRRKKYRELNNIKTRHGIELETSSKQA